MGYRKVPTIHTITDVEGEDGLVVRMKGVSFGKVRRLVALMDDDTKEGEVLDEIASQVAGNLVSWNLQDEDGVNVPATAEGVDAQEASLILGLVNAWLTKITGVDEELGKGSSSGATFPGQPVTMEAL